MPCNTQSEHQSYLPWIPKTDRKAESITPVNKDYASNSLWKLLPLWYQQRHRPQDKNLFSDIPQGDISSFSRWPGGHLLMTPQPCWDGERELLAVFVRTHCLFKSTQIQTSMAQVAQFPLTNDWANSTRSWSFHPAPFTWVSHDHCWPSTGNTRLPPNPLNPQPHFTLRILSPQELALG